MLRKLAARVHVQSSAATTTSTERNLSKYVWSAAWLRDAEREAAASTGITLSDLMVRAGTAAFKVFRSRYPRTSHWLIVVGTGNNGGDGYVIADLARRSGINVTVLAVPLNPGKTLPPEATAAKSVWEAGGGSIKVLQEPSTSGTASSADAFPADVDLIVDGLLGTGITGGPRGIYADIIARINAMQVPRVAIDIPSGLDAETGSVCGQDGGDGDRAPEARCVIAEHTVSFISLKPGLLTGRARDFVGQLHFAPLNLEEWMLKDKEHIDAAMCRRLSHEDLVLFFARRRVACAHKGSNGKVVLLGGSHGMGGAIMMAAEATLCSGAGLTRVMTDEAHVAPLLSRCPEVMVTAVFREGGHLDAADKKTLHQALEWSTTIAAGPGLGHYSDSSLASFLAVLEHARLHPQKTLVLDADALILLADLYYSSSHSVKTEEGHPFSALPTLPNSVVTPHPGEAARLLCCTIAEVEADRIAAARKIAAMLGGVCLLKGPGTIVYRHIASEVVELGGSCCPAHTHCSIIDAGNAGMATGGMGDVLTGVIAGISAQGFLSVYEATCAAALAHAVAADMVVEGCPGRGTRGLRATELIPNITYCVNCGTCEGELHSKQSSI